MLSLIRNAAYRASVPELTDPAVWLDGAITKMPLIALVCADSPSSDQHVDRHAGNAG
jgi:hypothetical protein